MFSIFPQYTTLHIHTLFVTTTDIYYVHPDIQKADYLVKDLNIKLRFIGMAGATQQD